MYQAKHFNLSTLTEEITLMLQISPTTPFAGTGLVGQNYYSLLPLASQPVVPAQEQTTELFTREINGLRDPWLPGTLDIWERSFHQHDRAAFSWAVRLIRDMETGKTEGRHLLATTVAGDDYPVAMAYYEVRGGNSDEAPVGYLVYLATTMDKRGKGLGTRFYHEVIGNMFAAGCRAVVFEVEIPAVVERICHEESSVARRRIAWYRRNGAFLIEGAVAVAGLGGPQPLPEAIMVHPHPDDREANTPEGAMTCARIGLGATAVEQINTYLNLI